MRKTAAARTKRKGAALRLPSFASKGLHITLLVFLGAVACILLLLTPAWEAMGYGVLIAVPLLTFYLVVLRLDPALLARHWHRWLSLVPLGLAAWGTLAFFDASNDLRDATLGGDIGDALIGTHDAFGVARLVPLGLASLVLLFPAASRIAVVKGGTAAGKGLWAAARSLGKAVWLAVSTIARWLVKAVPVVSVWVWRAVVSGVRALRHAAPSADTLLQAPAAATEAAGAVAARVTGRAKKKSSALVSPAEYLDSSDPATEAEGAVPAPHLSGGEVLRARSASKGEASKAAPAAVDDSDMPLARSAEAGGWRLPSIDVLDKEPSKSPEKIDNDARARSIEAALASYGIDGSVVEINPGPTVTQFGIEPGWVRKFRDTKVRDENGKFVYDENGNPVVSREEISRTRVKVDAISNLDKDLAMALAVPSIRIEAPIPGKAMVGLEVPNTHSETVTLRAGISSLAFQKLREKTKLAIVLGKGSAGQHEVADLAKMPHLLVAGTTGSGKSIGLRAILVSLLMQATPRELRLVLVDPKRVELVAFNSVPHLVGPVIVDVEKVVDALRWAIAEMEERYKKFAAVAARNLEAYNKSKQVTEPLPYLLIMIDELADLMMAAPVDVEHSIIRLAQLGRATGIHLVAATQRPSVNVVTGLIKANFPTRLSFAVSSLVDSRTILDSAGAEKLLGKGDMLYLAQDAPKPKRIQGVYVSDAEVERVVRAWSQQRPAAAGPSSGGLAVPADQPAAPVPSSAAAVNGKSEGGAPMPPKGGLPKDGTPSVPQVPVPVGSTPGSHAAQAASHPAAPRAITPAAQAVLATSAMATSTAALALPGAKPVEKDPLLPKAREIAEQYSRVSASLLQRKLKVGYNKAAHLMELLEEEGYGEGDDDDVF